MPEALLIDDEPNQLRGLAELVEREGFTTRTAGDARRGARMRWQSACRTWSSSTSCCPTAAGSTC